VSRCSAEQHSQLRDAGPPAACSSLYIHVPFCRDRCTYCAFPTVVDRASEHEPLVQGVLRELRRYPLPGPIRTLYLGGGTPSLVEPQLLAALIESVKQGAGLAADVEVTLETNPGQVSAGSLSTWADLGINRLSVGVQTFDDGLLRSLGRHDSSAAALDALGLIALHWQLAWSADLIVGWGRMGSDHMGRDIDRIVSFKPPHISVYGLTLEPGTRLHEIHRSTQREAVDSDRSASLDLQWSGALTAAGYTRYEVSNWAQPGCFSRHNQVYWRNDSYLGLGPGAASSIGPLRWVNRSSPTTYLAALHGSRSVRARTERLTPRQRLLESLATGLRTRAGVSIVELDRRYGTAWRSCVESQLHQLIDLEVVLEDAGQLRLDEAHITRADAIVQMLTRDLAIAPSR